MHNNTPNPVTLARDLLTIDTSAIGGNIIVDGVDVLETTRNAQKIARAMIAVAELVDRFEAERDTSRTEDEAITWDYAATLTDAALNGKIR